MPLNVKHAAKGKHIRQYICQGGQLTEQERANLAATLRELNIGGVKYLAVRTDGVTVEKRAHYGWPVIGPVVYAQLWAALVASVNPPKMKGWAGK